MDITVTRQGEDPASVVVGFLRQYLDSAARAVSYRVAARFAGRVRQVLIGQEYLDRWPPLSPRYLQWKIRNGLDPRLLIATFDYVHSIQARRVGDDYVVSPAHRVHIPVLGREQTVMLDVLGQWLEYGTWITSRNEDGVVSIRPRMPPRPHWRPAWQEFEANMEQHQLEMSEKVWAKLEPQLQSLLKEARSRVQPV